MAIRIDHSSISHLPYCTSCGWRGVTTSSTNAAHRQAAAHETERHPRDRHARNANATHHRRHADTRQS